MERINKRYSAPLFSALWLSLLIVICSCANSATEKQQKHTLLSETTQSEEKLLLTDAVLHQQLQAVQQADDEYNALLTNPATPTALDEKNGQIIQAEMALQQTIDSLEQRSQSSTTEAKKELAQLTGYFKATLENRRFLSDIRMIASADNDDSATMQQVLLRLRADVQEKKEKIALLERATSNRSKTATLDLPPAATSLERKLLTPNGSGTAQKSTYAPANGESLEQLKQRNKNLVSALNAVQTQYGTLMKYYRQLKQDYDRMLNEQAALRKRDNSQAN